MGETDRGEDVGGAGGGRASLQESAGNHGRETGVESSPLKTDSGGTPAPSAPDLILGYTSSARWLRHSPSHYEYNTQ